jgi:hypothetical protein
MPAASLSFWQGGPVPDRLIVVHELSIRAP